MPSRYCCSCWRLRWSITRDAPEIAYDLKHSVKLTLPRYFEPTQTAPNHGRVKPELDERSAAEGAQAQTRRFRPPAPAAGLAQPTAASLVEAPHIDLPQIEGPRSEPGALTGIESALASGAAAKRRRKMPSGEIRRLPAPRALASQTRGFDQPEHLPRIRNQTPAPCQNCSALQLLSDPQDVDFTPYLKQVLRVVKQNWLTVIPAEARQGRRGNVTVRFVIDKKGVISNLDYYRPFRNRNLRSCRGQPESSMSNSHFPPLPTGYKGDEVHLQMTFAYNAVQ